MGKIQGFISVRGRRGFRTDIAETVRNAEDAGHRFCRDIRGMIGKKEGGPLCCFWRHGGFFLWSAESFFERKG